MSRRARNRATMRTFLRGAMMALVACAPVLAAAASNARPTALDLAVPRYAHIFVIVEENKDYGEILGSSDAPTITRLAREYGNATNFYAETHPSEPNYVALIGGYTYGIRDDEAYFCKPHLISPSCPESSVPGYVDHTIDAPNLATQLEAAHLTWKNYLQSIPTPGSLVAAAGNYAAKHSGFINFLSVQRDPHRAERLVGFRQMYADLRSGNVPNFSLVIPNVCNEMHGAAGPGTPEDCEYSHLGKLIWRGDRNVAEIAGAIMRSPVWRSKSNAAIVVTFDEDDSYPAYKYVGCCGNDPSDPANRGGGHIPTIVITNHGPRHLIDNTPYSHYSLLRTIGDAFGIRTYLMRAAAPGVKPMLPLFRVGSR
jgi:phosphatidylinositol-3-phosphatase